MASRKPVTHDKTLLDKDNLNVGSERSDIAPAVPAIVIFKLLAFTFAMFSAPIGAYYLTLNSLFKGLRIPLLLVLLRPSLTGVGNATFAGATAAVVANLVLVAYIIVAMKEDQSERIADEKAKKGQ
ncbi:MAG: vacuolar ATPase assembly integral membrane protein vma21 [Cirrosporium novae-zelandiae]|nr:MAG: vacuolar ATPase assembly integral membrane protein vma21 [Cirrosporium novae-zelandiae]